jgi:MFS family permease
LADTWSKEQRGRGQSIYGTLTFFGPGIAPIIGAYIAQGADWNWIFHVTSFMTVVVQVCALFFLKESYEPVILAKEAKTIRKQMRKTNPDVVVRTVFQTMDRSPSERRTDLRKRLALPFVMMFTHPATIAPAVFRAYLYGVMYLMFSTFDTCFVDVYGMSEEHASLNFLSMCSGFVIGIHTVNPLMDWVSLSFSTLPTNLLTYPSSTCC